MVSCQEPFSLKGSKHSLQRHPHNAVLVNAHFFVSMGVEIRCRPCHSAAHHRHMKRQSFLCHCCHCRGRCHCGCCCHLCCHRQLRCHCCRRHPLPLPLLLPLPSPAPIAIAVIVDHCCRRLCQVAVSHCHCHCPCCWPLPYPSQLAIAVAISVGHHRCRRRQPFLRVVALAWWELYLNNLSKECLPYLFCSDSEWRTDQSRMTDQALSSSGLHQRWAASSKQQAASEGSGWQQGGSRGAAGWRRCLTMGGVVLLGCLVGSHWQMAFVMMCWMW